MLLYVYQDWLERALFVGGKKGDLSRTNVTSFEDDTVLVNSVHKNKANPASLFLQV